MEVIGKIKQGYHFFWTIMYCVALMSVNK